MERWHPTFCPVNGAITQYDRLAMGEAAVSATLGKAHGEATVQSLGRAVRLLRAMATQSGGAMLSALARETGLGKGTVHRLLSALIEAGLVFRDHDSKRYRLGAGLALLGHAAHRQDFAALSKPFLLRLAEETEDTIYASVREGGAAVCVAREVGAFPIRTLSLDVGHLRPLGVGSGSLALLAFLPDDEIAALIEKNATWPAIPAIRARSCWPRSPRRAGADTRRSRVTSSPA
jgi:DNA-binding IclR family transcriptional regulator